MKLPVRNANHERRVVQIARRAPIEPGGHRFEHLPVHSDGVPARAEREPVQVDRPVWLYSSQWDIVPFGFPTLSKPTWPRSTSAKAWETNG